MRGGLSKICRSLHFSICRIIIATSLVWLEGGVEGAVVLRDGAAEGPARGRVGRHLQQVRPCRVVRVYLAGEMGFINGGIV